MSQESPRGQNVPEVQKVWGVTLRKNEHRGSEALNTFGLALQNMILYGLFGNQ